MVDVEKFLKDFPHICFKKHWEISSDLHYMLGECNAMVQALRYLPLSPRIRQKMMEVSLIKGAMATTAIEGNTLSEDEVRAIQAGRSQIPQSRKYQEQEVRNVLDALNAIHDEVVKEHKISPVTPDLIKSFNACVGKELGEAFESVPGVFRSGEVVVGTYRAPDHRAVPSLVSSMCDWLRKEFSYEPERRPDFRNGIVEAIVAHVYLVWIHPFGDGNGRSARLLEFYLLLRSGIPNTCAHILSNHYNNTRSEYYRHLSAAGRTCDLTAFIQYAIIGLHDGLVEVLAQAQRHQIESCWRNHVYDTLDGKRLIHSVRDRYAKLLTNLDVFTSYTRDALTKSSMEVAAIYGGPDRGMILRDVKALIALGLLEEHRDSTYSVRTKELVDRLPSQRTFNTLPS